MGDYLSEMEKPLKWGILGAGIIAHKLAEALGISARSKLEAVASKTPEKASAFAEEFKISKAYTYSELVNDSSIDVIYIATTHNFHHENALLALNAGKHVLIEKPFTVNATQAEELIVLAKEKNCFLMEAMWTRFLPSVGQIKSLIDQGEIGQLKNMVFTFGGFTPPKYYDRLRDINLAGGVTLDMGIYPISQACFMAGSLPVEVRSMAGMSESGVDEVSNYMFRFGHGAFANITTSFNLYMKNCATFYGSEGYIEFPDFQRGQHFTVFRHGGTNTLDGGKQHDVEMDANGFIYQVEEVERCIAKGKTESTLMPLSETVAIMKLMDEMRRKWGFKYPFEKR